VRPTPTRARAGPGTRSSLGRRVFGRWLGRFALSLTAAHFGCAGDPDCPNDLPDDNDCASAAPSYSGHVGVVLEQYCEVCHLPGNGVSTHVFSNYDEIFATRRTMLTQIYACRMPIGPRRLNAEDRALLLKWFVCGAPNN
jgi:hypothetical protein